MKPIKFERGLLCMETPVVYSTIDTLLQFGPKKGECLTTKMILVIKQGVDNVRLTLVIWCCCENCEACIKTMIKDDQVTVYVRKYKKWKRRHWIYITVMIS